MGGAMTTTPTLAAAQDAVASGLVTPPAGFTGEDTLRIALLVDVGKSDEGTTFGNKLPDDITELGGRPLVH
jgi:hypothetical protein